MSLDKHSMCGEAFNLIQQSAASLKEALWHWAIILVLVWIMFFIINQFELKVNSIFSYVDAICYFLDNCNSQI